MEKRGSVLSQRDDQSQKIEFYFGINHESERSSEILDSPWWYYKSQI